MRRALPSLPERSWGGGGGVTVLGQQEWELPLLPGVKLSRQKSPKRANSAHNRDPRLCGVQCVGLCEDTFSRLCLSDSFPSQTVAKAVLLAGEH